MTFMKAWLSQLVIEMLQLALRGQAALVNGLWRSPLAGD